MNGYTLGSCPWNQKLENFVSPKVQRVNTSSEVINSRVAGVADINSKSCEMQHEEEEDWIKLL